MAIYIILLVVVFAAILADHSDAGQSNREKRSNYLLMALFLLIFFIFALRASSVGRDLPGYERVYGWTGNYRWNDYDYVYFENGYIFLMKVCYALGMSFQCFLAVVAAIILYPIYIFIRRYSTDKCLSCLIYVSYMLFEFDLTAVRQAIAMSVALMGFLCLMEEKKGYLIRFFILIWIASQFHKSALICILILPLRYLRNLSVYTGIIAVGSVASLVLRNILFQYLKNLFDKDTFNLDAGLHIGSNIFFMLVLAAFFYFAISTEQKCRFTKTGEGRRWLSQNVLLYQLFLLGIFLAIFFGAETSARSFMFYMQAIIVLMPNATLGLKKESSILFKSLFIVFFIWFFYTNTLAANNFDVVPYQFFWEAR